MTENGTTKKSFPVEIEKTPELSSTTIHSESAYEQTRKSLNKKERALKIGGTVALLGLIATLAYYNLSDNFTGAWHGLVEETATIPAETFTLPSTPTELADLQELLSPTSSPEPSSTAREIVNLEELLSPTASPDVIGTPLDVRPSPTEGGGIGTIQLSKFLQDEELCPNPGRLTRLYGERISPEIIRITIYNEDNPEDIDMLPIKLPREDRVRDAMGCAVGEETSLGKVFFLKVGEHNMTDVQIYNTTTIEIHLNPYLQLVTPGQPSSTTDMGTNQGYSAIQDIGTEFRNTTPTPISPTSP